MPDATFGSPDLTTFCRLDELGLHVVGQRLERDRAVLVCRVKEPDQWCRRCGCEGTPRDTVTIDLTGVRDGTGPALLLDMVTGRSKVVAMDGLAGFKDCHHRGAPDAVAVTDPSHVVRVAGDALDRCRRRVQTGPPQSPRPQGRPLYRSRRTSWCWSATCWPRAV